MCRLYSLSAELVLHDGFGERHRGQGLLLLPTPIDKLQILAFPLAEISINIEESHTDNGFFT